MSDIPAELLAEVLCKVEEEKGCPDKYTVPIEEKSCWGLRCSGTENRVKP